MERETGEIHDCSKCPHNQFGSGKNGSGKACKNIHRAEIKYSDIVIGDGELSETGENAASDNAKVIQAAFDEAKNKASDKNRYRIYFPKGEYHINTTLNIFSNTELYLDEKTTLVQDAPKGQNIVKAGDFSQKHILYNGFRNIKIDGGKWDMQVNGSCAMRFGHCTNLPSSRAIWR